MLVSVSDCPLVSWTGKGLLGQKRGTERGKKNHRLEERKAVRRDLDDCGFSQAHSCHCELSTDKTQSNLEKYGTWPEGKSLSSLSLTGTGGINRASETQEEAGGHTASLVTAATAGRRAAGQGEGTVGTP